MIKFLKAAIEMFVFSPKSSCNGQTINGTDERISEEKLSFTPDKKLINKVC